MRFGLNIRLVASLIGQLAMFESALLFLACGVAIYYGEDHWDYYVQSGGLALGIGTILKLLGIGAPDTITKKEGAIIVTSVWIVFSLIGMVPYLLTGTLDNVTDAFFETISGFTTVGATVINDIEAQCHSILFWRALTQWTGGIGIIVISLALLPRFGFSGMMMFGAEMAGPTKEKLSPKIADTAKKLGIIYLALTIAEVIALRIGGMSLFDAVCHSMTTTATGGFSTKNANIAHWGPTIQYIIMVFMFLSGINFTLYYFALSGKLKLKVFKNEELKGYALIVVISAIIMFICLYDINMPLSLRYIEETARKAFFQAVAIMTSTGFVESDFTLWPTTTWIIIILLMLCGASAGSSTGGIKLSRIIIALKYCYYEFKRMVHPHAVIPVTYSGTIIKPDIISRVFAFIFLYVFVIIIGTLVLNFTGMNAAEAISGMVACVSNCGLAFGDIGPSNNFADISVFSKWFMTFAMLLGRLEIFTVLLLFTPVFWEK